MQGCTQSPVHSREHIVVACWHDIYKAIVKQHLITCACKSVHVCFMLIWYREYAEALKRIALMTRGIGDPLVAVYARCYLSRVSPFFYIRIFILLMIFMHVKYYSWLHVCVCSETMICNADTEFVTWLVYQVGIQVAPSMKDHVLPCFDDFLASFVQVNSWICLSLVNSWLAVFMSVVGAVTGITVLAAILIQYSVLQLILLW